MMSKSKADINIGLALLRPLLCFEVIVSHFFEADKHPSLWVDIMMAVRPMSVTAFMMISFFFLSKHITDFDKHFLIKRIQRIVVPIICWSIISYFYHSAVSGIQPMRVLFLQILAGHTYLNNPMWFMNGLLALTILFMVLSYISKQWFPVVISVLGIIALYLQYSDINYNLFRNLQYELQYPLGRICEVLPSAVVGMLLGLYGRSIIDWFKSRIVLNWIVILCFLILFILFNNYWLPREQVNGFGCHGGYRLLQSLILVSGFYLIPFGNVSIKIINTMLVLTSFTLGIYCMHSLVGRTLESITSLFCLDMTGTIGLCLLIYVISYLLCLLISKIPFKICGKLVN